MTERSTHNQIAVRITRGSNEANSPASCTALEQLDLLMHNVGRGALDIWLRLLLRDTQLSNTAGRGAIGSIQEDLRFERFNENLPTSFIAGEVSPG